MRNNGVRRHAEQIFSLVEGKTAGKTTVDLPVVQSWERCVRQYGIDPGEESRVQVLTQGELQQYTQSMEKFMRIARAGFDRIQQQVSPLGYATLLCDPNGVTIDWRGDEKLTREWKRAGLYFGAIWTEENQGTCAVGTGLIERSPLTIHKGEHFRTRHSSLTCSMAPIFDPLGEMLALLDVSALHSPDSKDSQHLTLQLVILTARMIESAYFLGQFEDQWVLSLSACRELAEVSNDCLIALDGQGRILAADQTAEKQFGGNLYRTLAGRDISDIFDINFEQVIDYTGRAGLVWPIRTARGGGQFFATLRLPRAIHIKPIPPVAPKPAPAAKPPIVGEPLTLDYLAGSDCQLQGIVARMKRVMDKNISLVLNGETGTGKEVFAQAIHNASRRAGKPFVALNCASIPESLIESELFGYKEGAFTGARSKGMQGKILQSQGGTLFLDEIGDMPESLQPRLLRVLAEKEITPLGGDAPIPVDLHVICATHRNIREMVEAGTFREDLYYRLNGIAFELPPLRQRSDIARLIQSALTIEAEAQAGQVSISPEALEMLSHYEWPGNIRQLRNALRYALAVCEDGRIGPEDLPEEITFPGCGLFSEAKGEPSKKPKYAAAVQQDGGSVIEQAEKGVIADVLARHQWKIALAAHEVGISRATLYRKMEKYGIVPPNKR